MKKKNININLQIKIKRFIEYNYEVEKEGYFKGSQLLSGISSNLKEELNFDAYGNCIRKHEIFSKNFSEDFLKKLTNVIQEFTYTIDDSIVFFF